MSSRLAVLAVAALVAVGAAAAITRMQAEAAVAAPEGTPRTAAAVPLFPGLTKVSEEPGGGGGLTDGSRQYPLIEGTRTIYVTTAPAEEVYAFYLAQLGGKTEWGDEVDHTRIGPNQATPVIRKRNPYQFEDTEDPMTGRAIPAASQRAMLSNARPASSEGDWLFDGSFSWVAKDASGAPIKFHVSVIDESVTPVWAGYSPKTGVEIYVQRFGLLTDR